MKALDVLLVIVCVPVIHFGQGPDGELSPPKPNPSTKSVTKSKPKAATQKPKTQAPEGITSKRTAKPSIVSKAASLRIVSLPAGSSISLNGNLRGTSLNDGTFAIPSLKAGDYVIGIKREGYRDRVFSIRLSPGQEQTIEGQLIPLDGAISVIANVDGAVIEIPNVGTYSGAVSRMSIPPGEYEVLVRKVGYKTVTERIIILPGRTATLNAKLTKLNLDESLAMAKEEMAKKNYTVVVALCKEILSQWPANPDAQMLAGTAYYYLQNYDLSFGFLVNAVNFGSTVQIWVKRRRLSVYNESLEWGVFELRKDSFAFLREISAGQNRQFETIFDVPYSKVLELKIEKHKNAYFQTQRIEMKVAVPQAKGKDDKKDFDFFASSATSQNVGSSSPMYKIRCDNCEGEINFIFGLVTNFRDAPGRPTLVRRQPETKP